jgi:hypothetical protein
MANRRNKLMDAPVNPAIMPGFFLIADDVTVDDGAVVTITFPAKTIWTVMVQTTGTSVAKTKAVSSSIGTVTLTATGAGTISYIIFASVTETVADLDILTASTYAITPIT